MLQGEEAKPVRQLIQRIFYWKAQGLSPEALTDAIDDFLRQSVASEELSRLAEGSSDPGFIERLTAQALGGTFGVASAEEPQFASNAPVKASQSFAPVATKLRDAIDFKDAADSGAYEALDDNYPSTADPNALPSELPEDVIKTSNSIKFSELDIEFFDEVPEPAGPRFSFDPLGAIVWVYGRIDGLVRLCTFDYLSIPTLIIVSSIAVVGSMPFWIENPEFDKAQFDADTLSNEADRDLSSSSSELTTGTDTPELQISRKPRVESQVTSEAASNFLTSKVEDTSDSSFSDSDVAASHMEDASRGTGLAAAQIEASVGVATESQVRHASGESVRPNQKPSVNAASVNAANPDPAEPPARSRAEQDMIDLDRVLSAAHQIANVPTLDEIASMIDAGDYHSAVGILVESRERYDSSTADLLLAETLLRMGDGPSKLRAWEILQDRSNDFVSDLLCARLLLGCTPAQRSQLAEKPGAAGSVQPHYRLWASTAKVGRNKALLSDLQKRAQLDSRTSCLDCVFLANANFTLGNKEDAHRELIAAHAGLKRLSAQDATGATTQWLVTHSVHELSTKVQRTVKSLSGHLTSGSK